jgi:hypothetical protein
VCVESRGRYRFQPTSSLADRGARRSQAVLDVGLAATPFDHRASSVSRAPGLGVGRLTPAGRGRPQRAVPTHGARADVGRIRGTVCVRRRRSRSPSSFGSCLDSVPRRPLRHARSLSPRTGGQQRDRVEPPGRRYRAGQQAAGQQAAGQRTGVQPGVRLLEPSGRLSASTHVTVRVRAMGMTLPRARAAPTAGSPR